MALNSLGMGLTFNVTDKATGPMNNIQQSFNKTGRAAGKMASKGRKNLNAMVGTLGALATAAAAVTIAFGVKAAGAFGSFEQGIAKVGAISQASEEDLARLAAAAKQAGIDTQFSPVEATEGLANLAQAGFDATRSMELLTPVLDLAAGGQISLAQSSATVAAAVKAFGLEGEAAAGVADRLLKISNVTALAAGDLQLALGNVARGAGATGQALEEMLPAIGMVKDTGVEASVAASSVSSALLFMAKNARKFAGVGVEVTDAQGKFRPFLDIVQDTSAALGEKFPNAAKRAAKMTELFGRFGLTAANAIGNQLARGIKVAGVEGLKGADAISAMRKQMAGATGTAEKFKDQLLDTFAGQKTLLKGSAETLLVTIGETFAAVFRPMIEGLIKGINKLIKWIDRMPKSLKVFIAATVLGGVAIIGVIGAIAGLIAAASALGVTWGVVAGLIAGAGVIFAGVAVAIGAVMGMMRLFKIAYEENLGGFKDFVDNVVTKVTLAWDALGQLFSDGVLSGKVREELLQTEHEGLLNFVTKVFAFTEKVKAFFEGMFDSIDETFASAGPTFERLVDALKRLGDAFDFLGDKGRDFQSDIDKAGAAGDTAGSLIGDAFVIAVEALTLLIEVGVGVSQTFDDIAEALEPVGEAFDGVVDAVSDLASEFGFASSSGFDLATVARLLGASLTGGIVLAANIAGGALRGIVTMFRSLVNIFRGVTNIVKGIFTGDWALILKGGKQLFFGFVQGTLGMFETLVGGIAGLVDAIGKIFGKKFDFAKTISGVRGDIEASLVGIGPDVTIGKTSAQREKEEREAAARRVREDVSLRQELPIFSPGAMAAISQDEIGALRGAAPRRGASAKEISGAIAAGLSGLQIQTTAATLNVDGAALGEFVAEFKASTDKAGGKEVNVAVE